MNTAIEPKRGEAIARPLKVLAPLIKEELNAGDAAGIEHYRKAGEMLHEAAESFESKTELWAWGWRTFKRKKGQLSRYMALAELPALSADRKAKSLGSASLRSEVPYGSSKVAWQAPVQQVMGTINFERLRRERQEEEQEASMQRQLALKLIDIGYRVLAAKMHPDKPTGSKEGMQRLNEVKRRLKEAVS